MKRLQLPCARLILTLSQPFQLRHQQKFLSIFPAMVANGKVDSVFVPVESEHSAMSATIGASAAGARAMTATSSCGLAYMWEMLYVAASDRLPLALALVNRALSGPVNHNCDHSDAMGARDAGWIQLFSENNQEAYDNMVMAFRISEHPDVRLPIMVCQDGFIISHGVENIELLEDDVVKNFVGEYRPEHYLLNASEPLAIGPYANPPYVMEAKRANLQALENSKKVMLDVAADFERISGRKYSFFESYRMEDADYAMGSSWEVLPAQAKTLLMHSAAWGPCRPDQSPLFRPFRHPRLQKH